MVVPDRVGSAAPELERFARETLGCACPAEVFERVEEWYGFSPDLPGIGRRMAIGGRLLIYIAEIPRATDAVAWVRDRLAGWVRAGVAERDSACLNRLRIVLALPDPTPETVDAIESGFRRLPELAGPDPRVHLHCLAAAAVPLP